MILYVCSQGKIRSRTAEVLTLLGGLNARCCGTDADAMAPVNNVLLRGAELVICMERTHAKLIRAYMGAEGKPVVSLGIRDVYSPFEPELMRLLATTIQHQDERVGQAIALGLERLDSQKPEYAAYSEVAYATSALAFP